MWDIQIFVLRKEREGMEEKREKKLFKEDYMEYAIKLAMRGEGWVSPNPLVGAVIIKEGKIIGEGWHERYGEAHAERNALLHCKESPVNSTLYVTLEPCCHQGKQPPCTEAIIKAGIKKVVIGTKDPNPLVAGKGIQILKDHGIEVIQGILEEKCRDINRVFFHYIQTGMPYVTMKYAMTMDGKIATAAGKSKWITGEAAREHVHKQRHKNRGIMVGVGTIIKDNPMLDCRIEGGRNPLRIICDSHLRIPKNAKVVTTAEEIPTYLVTTIEDQEKWKPYVEAGCKIIVVPEAENKVNIEVMLKELGKAGIDSILLEGGGQLNGSFLSSGLFNALQVYLAPKLFGGKEGISPIGGAGILDPKDSIFLKNRKITLLGQDILIESEVERDVHRNSGRSREN